MTAEIGHNSGEVVNATRLKSFVKRIEKLNEDRDALTADIREIYTEAKGVGYETKIIRQAVRRRKMDAEKRREQEELLELYMGALDE